MLKDNSNKIKFLDSYEKGDINIYFGRNDETEELYLKVKKTSLTVVYGYSGTGKTSLIQCGLANKFSDNDWFEIMIRKRRGLTLNESTFQAIQDHAKKTILSPYDKDINSKILLDALTSLYRDYFRSIYLIYDQFEELFIQGSDDEKKYFFDFLKNCIASEIDVKIILVIREDWLGSLDEFENKSLDLMKNRFRLERMSKKTIIDVLRKILKNCGIKSFEPINSELDVEDTADLIYGNIKDPQSKIVDLPYMQVYLDKLIKTLPDNTTVLKKGDVDNIGKLDDVLSVYIEEKVKEIAEIENCTKEDIWTILNALVSVDGTKQRLKVPDLKKSLKIEKYD